MAHSEPSTAASRSASAKTRFGLFPPSSSETRFSVSAATLAILRPVLVSPVNASLSIPGWRAIASPTSPPGPVTTLRTPPGMPASIASSPRRTAVSGVAEAGLRTMVQPAASAGATFQIAIMSG